MFACVVFWGAPGLRDRDVRILLGMARQIDWYANGGWRQELGATQAERINLVRIVSTVLAAEVIHLGTCFVLVGNSEYSMTLIAVLDPWPELTGTPG